MTRPAAAFKGQFFPLPPPMVDAIARWLRAPAEPFSCLDPCAGLGEAAAGFCQRLGGSWFGVELDEGRAAIASTVIERGLWPASFLGTNISAASFSLIYVNPPFGSELGSGGRVEQTFLAKSTRLLRTNGILCLVCPESVADAYDTWQQLATNYQDIARFPFPDEIRHYDEVVVIGRKRSRPADVGDYGSFYDWEWNAPSKVYEIPPGPGPAKFEKSELTPLELERAMLASSLMKHLQAPEPARLPSPPLALGRGHLGLLLASGQLDGIVRPPGEPPHVVRGLSFKETYVDRCETRENDDGSETVVTVYSERPRTTIRAVDSTGTIRTFNQ